VTLRIEISSDGHSKVLQLIGELRAPELEELAKHLPADGAAIRLDLAGLRIVDLDAVQFLIRCEDSGVAILNCPPYVREWMNLEKVRTKQGERRHDK